MASGLTNPTNSASESTPPPEAAEKLSFGLPAPKPLPPQNGKELQDLNDYAKAVTSELKDSMTRNSQYIDRSYRTVFIMYVSLFIVGILTAVAAIIKGLLAQNGTAAIPSLIFAGLSAASFFTLFIVRPLQSLEQNTFFSSWIISIMNTYWARLMYFNDLTTIDKDLKDATTDLVTELSNLADKYAATIGKYPSLVDATSQGNNPPKPAGG